MREGNARIIVDANMDVLPADAAAVALTGPIPCDAMADLVEVAELLDIEVDHVAGML